MGTKSVKNFFKAVFNFFTDRLNFCIVYFSLALIWTIPCINLYVDRLMQCSFLWGIGLIVWDFFTKKNMFRGYKSILLVLFLVSYFVTVILNFEILYVGVKHFFYSAIVLLLFYPFGEDVSFDKQKKYAVMMNDVFAILTFAVSLLSILMFVFRISYNYTVGETVYGQGVIYNRLYGLYISANPGALMSTCAVFLSIVTYFLDKKHFKKFRVFYIINAVIQFIFYTLTLSNGGYIAWIAGIFGFCVLFVFPYIKKRRNVFVSLLLSAVVFAASFGLFEGASLLSRSGMVKLASFVTKNVDVSIIPEDSDASNTNTGEEDEVVLERVEGDVELNNGRVTIWDAGLAALKQKPIFGWADSRFYSGEEKLIPVDDTKLTEHQISELDRSQGYMHNAIVQIAVCSGIAGLAFFVLFAAFIGIKYVIAAFKLYKHKYKEYYAFAAIFMFIVIMLSQMAAEAHVLFTRQDAYASAFWFYLGLGICYLKSVKKESAEDFAFVCDTPLQVMNAASFVLSNEKDCAGKSDVYIYHQFGGSEQLAANIRESGIFRNVYEFDKITFSEGLKNKLSTLLRFFFPKRALKKICRDKNCLKENYRSVVVCFYTSFTDLIKFYFKPQQVIQLEDGLGSYVTADLEARYRSGLFEKINKFVLAGEMSYNAKELYLNTPALAGEQVLEIKKLESFASTDEKLSLLKKVYSFNGNSPYGEQKAVYITQPLSEKTMTGVSEKEALELLSVASPVMRIHPRQNAEEFAGFTQDTVRNMWELECAENITDEHLLIGAFSTAQFTPKMMFDREPTLVFLYKLYGCDFDNADAMVERIKAAYRDKDKVIVVETKEQLKEIAQKYKG